MAQTVGDHTLDRLREWGLSELRPHIAAGTPLVGMEPSCLAAFRDELVNLFPNDADARRLSSQSFTLAEFLTQRAPAFALPGLLRASVPLTTGPSAGRLRPRLPVVAIVVRWCWLG